MIALKPPGKRDALKFGDAVALALAFTVVTTQVLDFTGLRANRADIDTRWSLPLFDIDVSSRWEGMFTDPNLAGFIGAFLFVYALARQPKRSMLWLVALGGLVVVASESRSALIALGIGATTFGVLRLKGREPRILGYVAAGVLSGIAIAAAGFFVFMDPSLNGRVPIWQSMTGLAQENPLFGVGSDGVNEASRQGVIPGGNLDGHNVVLDVAVRNGIPAGALVLTILIATLFLCIRARTNDDGLSLSVYVTFLAGATTYNVTTWKYPGVQLLPLLVALLVARAFANSSTRGESTQGMRTTPTSRSA